VVGHRCAPFVHEDVPLGEVKVLFGGEALPQKMTRMAAADSVVYCTLLGKVGWIEHLIDANGEGVALTALESGGTVQLPTLDLGPVLARYPGASEFVVGCVDYTKGVVQIVGVRDPAAPVDFRALAAASAALDAAFAVVFAEWGPEAAPIPEQIALAYAHMPEGFFANPPFHFGGYLELTKTVAIATGFMNTTLWRADEDPKDAMDPEDRDEIEEMIEALQAAIAGEKGGREAPRSGKRARSSGTGKGVVPTADPSTALPWPVQAARRPAGSTARIYWLDVALDGQKRIRRRIEIHEENTWQDLHEAIFDAFDRDDEHLYAFYLTRTACASEAQRRRAPTIGLDLPSEGLSKDRDAACTRIGAGALKAKDKLYYLFDFGDEWWHEITVVNVQERQGADAEDYPKLVESKGDSPPQYPNLDDEE
jgi:hypothetical protein